YPTLRSFPTRRSSDLVSIQFSSVDGKGHDWGTATANLDYTLSLDPEFITSGPLVIPKGQSSGAVYVTPKADSVHELDETAIVKRSEEHTSELQSRSDL